jgi:YD repeat-containing protein
VTQPDGYAVTTDYDGLNRMTRRTYPDASSETFTYDRLEVGQVTDRLGRITRYVYDRARRVTAIWDALGRTIRQEWCPCGALKALVDANGHRTAWTRDAGGRVITETRADGATQTHYSYDLAGRLATVTDPKGQVTSYTYFPDDAPSGVTYTNAALATPGVTYTVDPVYPRVATMVDGTGTTTYTYRTAGQTGAGQVASVDGPLPNDTMTYEYDELGRVTSRAINGAANTVTWTFDSLGRGTTEANVLGTFSYTYDGVTSRLATVTSPNGQTSTYTYLPNAADHRLQTIHHQYPGGATLSPFDMLRAPRATSRGEVRLHL